MRIAVTSQNLKEVTGHAGRCRSFIVFESTGGDPGTPQPVKLPAEQVFHEWDGVTAHPLAGVEVLITGGIGAGLADRLRRQGVQTVVTDETNPELAVRRLIEGTLTVIPAGCTDDHVAAPRRNGQGQGPGQGHGHGAGGGACGCRCGH